MSASRPQRRQVLTAGAWTVPVVVVATAAPAFATSGSDLSTSTMTTTITGNGINRQASLAVTIVNSGYSVTTALTVRIQVSGGIPIAPVAPAGWTLAYDAVNNVLVYTANAQLAAGASTAATFVVRPGNSSSSAVVSVSTTFGTGRTFASASL